MKGALLTRCLEEQPLLDLVFLRRMEERQRPVFVVLINDIIDYSARLHFISVSSSTLDIGAARTANRTYFPQHYASVRVFEGREAAIRVDVDIRLSLSIFKLHQLIVKGYVELFEDDVNLAALVSAIFKFPQWLYS